MSGHAVPLAVIGAGRVAHAVHLRVLRDLTDEFRLVAVVETNPERAAATRRHYRGIPVVSTLSAAVRAGARAALCATPWATHAQVVGEALDEGLAVLCEKPVSLDPAEIESLLAWERRAGVPVAVGYMKRHDPAVQAFLDAAMTARDLVSLSVAITDPNAAHQVAHLIPAGCGGAPDAATRQAGQARLREIRPDLSDRQRQVYAHGLGGSLTHHVNLAHAMLGVGSLEGRLTHSVAWADGTGVAVGWRPRPGTGVQMSHVRVPAHGEYREVLEAVTGNSRLRLELPSPYARDDGGVLEVRTWDGGASRSTVIGGQPGETGFVRQLRNWAAVVRGERGGWMPGLAEALADMTVVREAVENLDLGATDAVDVRTVTYG